MNDFFLMPDRLWHLLWLIPLMILLQLYAQKRRKNALQKVLGVQHHPEKHAPIGVNVSQGRRFFRYLLLTVVACLCVGAYARPVWGKQLLSVTGSGRDIMILFDVSKSMLANDLPPTRMAHAKLLVEDILKQMPGDRFGLIPFAGRAFVECPLTSDRVSFLQILRATDEQSIPIGGTNLEEALKLASERFKGAETENCAIMLITDGEEHVGRMESVLGNLNKAKIPLVVVGIGDPIIGSAIQLTDENGKKRFLTDRSGAMVKSKLNEEGLRKLAAETHGIYIHSSLQSPGDREIVARLKQLTPNAHETQNKTLPIDRWIWFLGPAFLLFLIFIVFHERAKPIDSKFAYGQLLGKLEVWACFFIGTLFFGFNTDARAETEIITDTPIITPQMSAEKLYNVGVEAQHNNDYNNAESAYLQSLSKGNLNPELEAKVQNNYGAIQHLKGREKYTVAENVAQQGMEGLDSALMELNDAMEKYNLSQNYYTDALAQNPNADIQNQKLLLNEKERVVELQKAIEEIKKKMQEAQQQSQEAQENQQKANQNSAQQQQQKQQAQKQRQKAQDAMNQAQKNAEKVQNKDVQKQIKDIQKDLNEAQNAQEKNDGKKAEDALKKAGEKLKQLLQTPQNEKSDAPKNDQDKSDKKDKGDKKEEKQEKEASDAPSKEDAKQQDAQMTEGEEKNEKIDQKTGEILLREMQREEENLRKEIMKNRLQKNGRLPTIEKDW